jgi:dipeptidyl aminopeptidase/acylaminoacyl peptidase
MPLRLGLLAILLLTLAVAVAAAALLLRTPFSPRGLIAYTTGSGNSGIHLIAADGTGDRPLTDHAGEIWPRWSADGRKLLFIRSVAATPGSGCDTGTEVVIHDLETGQERGFPTEPLAWEAEWSPSGGQVGYFVGGECGHSGFGLIDVASGRVTTSDATGAVGFFWTGDALTFVYPDHLGTLAMAALDGPASPETVLTLDAEHVAFPSPAGRYAAVARKDGLAGPVEVVDLGDGSRIDLGPGGIGFWSPDGSALAFVQPGVPDVAAGQSRDRLVVTVGLERRVRSVTEVVAWGASPTQPAPGTIQLLYWTADGRAIYWRDAIGAHAVDVATGQRRDLPQVLAPADDFRWQPPT